MGATVGQPAAPIAARIGLGIGVTFIGNDFEELNLQVMQLGELRTNREARPRPTSEKDMRGLGNNALDPSNLV